jgi:carboxymethylenebutenolidase
MLREKRRCDATLSRMNLPAYVARPAVAKPGSPGVVVAFEMFGLTSYVRRVADRVAELGYTAIAPDYYHRFGDDIALEATPEGRTQGIDLLRKLDRASVFADSRAALELIDGPAAALGLSVGGHLAYYSATQLPFVAVAAFYPGWLTSTEFPIGQPEPTLTLTSGLKSVRTLLLTGADDHLLDAEVRSEVTAALSTAGISHELVVYPDTPHGYFCDERESYRPGPAADSWRRVTELFRSALE